MGLDLISTSIGAASTVIDKIFPDKNEAEKAKLELFRMQQQGEFKELEERMAAIQQEAASLDAWTSRARPAFLYVVYIMILASIPMGILYAFQPVMADNIATGMQKWLGAIPEAVWWLFGGGYLGYTIPAEMKKKGFMPPRK